MPQNDERYSKQILFHEIGKIGQEKLANSRVLLCGCGALGSVLAETLTRAGVGFLRIVDRDFVEISNLQRQVLYDEKDIEEELPKAIAAANKLRLINSSITIEPHIADIDHTNILKFAEGIDLILDGTDNFEIRFLINDISLETGIPWIYTGVIASQGQLMTIIPNQTACLRCLIESVPPPGTTETCDTAGVLGPAVNVIASLESVQAIKLLTGKQDAISPDLTIVDVWDFTLRKMNLGQLKESSNCPACQKGERLWLTGQQGSQSVILCGRNAVQISPPEKMQLDLKEMESKLQSTGKVHSNRFLLKLIPDETNYEITLFKDGRAIIKGTDEISVARTIYSRYIGL
jgi:molybdopterin-synthase adenylyltransferase